MPYERTGRRWVFWNTARTHSTTVVDEVPQRGGLGWWCYVDRLDEMGERWILGEDLAPPDDIVSLRKVGWRVADDNRDPYGGNFLDRAHTESGTRRAMTIFHDIEYLGDKPIQGPGYYPLRPATQLQEQLTGAPPIKGPGYYPKLKETCRYPLAASYTRTTEGR